MLQGTVIVALLVAVSGVSARHLSARKAECGGINPVVREEPFPSTLDGAPLPNCKDIALTGSPELTEYTCFMPAEDVVSETTAPSGMHNATLSPVPLDACAGSLACTNSFAPPSAGDAGTLCAIMPDSNTVGPYSGGYGCVCSGFGYASALYMTCNCDCSTIAFTALRSDCQTLLVDCTQTGWGAFHSFTSMNAYMMLQSNTASPSPPVPCKAC
ncbi:hypothetical protein C8Q80DRAFT_1213985 [Daedaleopsis nitida]|nr:hypothetical protein C8Q80DRAFT_1213985 [Daedaleopsis nitida]